jgi:hypothetical protein
MRNSGGPQSGIDEAMASRGEDEEENEDEMNSIQRNRLISRI